MAKLTTRTEGRCPKAAREGKRGKWGTRLSGRYGDLGAGVAQRAAVDAAGAATGKGRWGVAGGAGIVMVMVAGRWWVVEGC